MKTIIYILLIVLQSFAIIALSAQETESENSFSFGLDVSGGMSNTSIEVLTYNNNFSWSSGLIINYNINKKWFIESKIAYQHRNHYKDGTLYIPAPLGFEAFENTTSLASGHLSIPIGIGYRYTFLDKQFRISSGINSSFFLYSQYTNKKVVTFDGRIFPENKRFSSSTFNPIDFSLFINKGIDIPFSKFTLIPSIYFQLGLTDTGGDVLMKGHYDMYINDYVYYRHSWYYSYFGINMQVIFK